MQERERGPKRDSNTTMMGFCKRLPIWMDALLEERLFFQPCFAHEAERKNERNIFCLDCCCSFCLQCLHRHRSHRLIQIRRYVYQDVIRLDDLDRLIDCSLVQSYTTNSAKVVFIHERPQTRPFRVSGNVCLTCDRPLQDPFLFCSLSCKVRHLLRGEGSVSTHPMESEFHPSSDPCMAEDGRQTPISVLESPVVSSASSASGLSEDVVVGRRNKSCWYPAAAAEKPRMSWRSSSECGRRRKGAPCRSPLY